VETLLSLLVGFLSGVLYNEHIYRQSIKFPKSNPFHSFLIRLFLLGAVAAYVAKMGGVEALLAFLGGNLAGRFLHTLLRAFVIVRY